MGCNLCPFSCNVNRAKMTGRCGALNTLRIAKYYIHPYEEPVLTGENGSGTVFFCGCSLKCAFCQNYEVSRNMRGKYITVPRLAEIFKELEDRGAANINLVSPTHYADKIAEALDIYKPALPVIYNTHGYERIETLRFLDKYIDVYLPDMKFFSPALSKRYAGVSDYFERASAAIEFMAKKPVKFNEGGVMTSGTLVRHLVLPQCTFDSKKILDWFCGIKDRAYINVMSQYTPFGNIKDFPELQRKITAREYNGVLDYAISLGIENMFYQKIESADTIYIPEWDY